MVSHTHVEDLFGHRNDTDIPGFLDEIGQLLAFFWQQAANQQFPNTRVRVTYKDGIIFTTQPHLLSDSPEANDQA